MTTQAGAPEPLEVVRGPVTLAGEVSGSGPAVLLLHGLTATRRYVVHGSRAIERAGHRVIAFDARGHGRSSPAGGPGDYTYDELVADALAVLDAKGVDRAALVGQSMGSATAVALTLRHPERVSALVVVTPAHLGRPSRGPRPLGRPGRGAPARRSGRLPGGPRAPHAWASAGARRCGRSSASGWSGTPTPRPWPTRCAASRAPPRSTGWSALDGLAVPALVVGSRDEVDPDHPLARGRGVRRRIPGARLVVEDEGESPIAWRGGVLSREVLALLPES